jgi:hypothetical protein
VSIKGFKGSRVQGFKLFWGVVLTLTLLNSTPVFAGDLKIQPDERKEVEQAARRYLDAEVRRDFKEVYGSLYPSSDYCRANNYGAYLTEAQSSPVRIESFKIIRVALFEENPVKEKLPGIEGFARVEVDLILGYADTNQKAEINYDFPFVKAGGKWYKL